MENTNPQVEKLADALFKAMASVEKPEVKSTEEKRAILKTIANRDDAGNAARKAYAESRASVILPLIPVQSTVRSIFQTENLAADAQAKYIIGPEYTEFGAFLPKFGGTVVNVTEGDELYVPTFNIEGGYRYSMEIAEQGRIDIAETSNRQMLSRVVAKEEFCGWRTIKGILSGLNANQTVYCSGTSVAFPYFSKQAINKLMNQMDVQRRDLTDLYMSPRSLADVREWSQVQVDFMTQRDIFVNGGLPGGGPDGGLWGIKFHKVYDSSLVGNTEVYGFDTKTFGKMPIKKEFTTYEDPTAILQWMIGVQGRENVGFGVTDTWAIVKGIIDSAHTTPGAC